MTIDRLKLANQVCFPIYTLAKAIINCYRPFLDKLDLTYPQYLVMLVLWEQGEQTVTGLGEQLSLDTGTLTPLLKRLEQKGLVSRTRKKTDERVVHIALTDKGEKLQEPAADVPLQLIDTIDVPAEDIEILKSTIQNILVKINKNKEQ